MLCVHNNTRIKCINFFNSLQIKKAFVSEGLFNKKINAYFLISFCVNISLPMRTFTE